jgi:tetratricopeptide (TPR) repeat protein
VGILAPALCIGWEYRERQRTKRVADGLFQILERGDDLTPFEATIVELERTRGEGSFVRRLLQGLGDSTLDDELRLLRGARYLDGDEDEKARSLIGQVPAAGPRRIPRLVLAGRILFREGRLTDAERTFRRVEAESPQTLAAHRWLATVYHELGAMQASLDELLEVTRLRPDDFFAYRLIGILQSEDFGRFKEAAEFYREALERNPPPEQLQSIRRELAECLLFANDYAGALEVLKEAQADARVLALEAECRWSLGEPEETVKLLSRALELAPRDQRALTLSARLALDRGDPKSAVEPLKALLEADPHDYDAHYQLATAWQRLGDKEAAALELEKMNKSKALHERLRHAYERAMHRSNDADIREEIAQLCEQLGKARLAQLWRRAADERRPPRGILGSTPKLAE